MHINYDIVNQNYILISLCAFKGHAMQPDYNETYSGQQCEENRNKGKKL